MRFRRGRTPVGQPILGLVADEQTGGFMAGATGTVIRTRWTPKHVARHYGFPADLNGHGQTIAVINLGEHLDLDELRGDLARAALPAPPMRQVPLPAARAPAGTPGKADDPGTVFAIETHIDAEILAAICPAAVLAIYSCAAATADDIAAALQAAVSDDADVISISWGSAEDGLTSGQRARVQAALHQARDAGITVCAAAGDAGAAGVFDAKGRPVYGLDNGIPQVKCIFPASSDLVLACGGTSLMKDESGLHEVVWNDAGSDGWIGGGGVSTAFDRPDWQARLNLAVPPAHGPGTFGPRGRVLPDVAGLAAMGDWAIWYRGGKEGLLGGTSAVAPLYAALIALANQKRRRQGKARLGFVNDRLYALAARGGLFTGIVAGSNRLTPDGPGYDAATGFDACTGWGVPRADRLIAALAAAD
jgi:kumamolisin